MIAALIILLGIAVSYSLWQVLTEDAPAKVMPLSPDDEALQQHYRDADAWRVKQMAMDRAKSRRLLELNYQHAQAIRTWRGHPIRRAS